MITIGLLWHSISSDNLGVGALSLSQILLLDKASKRLEIPIRFVIYGTVGDKQYLPPEYKDIVRTTRVSLGNLAKISFAAEESFRQCDLVLDLGEGDSFTDLYGAKRFLKMTVSKALVLASKTPLILSPQTIGPFNNHLCRAIALKLLNASEAVFVRDHLSYEYLQGENFKKDIRESIDLAFALPYETQPLPRINGKPNIGINISGLLYNGGYTRGNQFRLSFSYAEFIHQLLEQLLRAEQYEIYLVPHVLSERIAVEDDYRLNQQLKSKYPALHLAPKFASPIEAKSFISSLDFFIGSRMHATIAAFSGGVPVVPVAYSRKFKGLFSSLGYNYTADATSESKEKVIASIIECLERREDLRSAVEEGRQQALAKLAVYETFLAQTLEALHSRERPH